MLALVDASGKPITGNELLTLLVVGYEVAIRAGIALHATAPDYHTSGAWNALGAVEWPAAAGSLDDDRARTRSASPNTTGRAAR